MPLNYERLKNWRIDGIEHRYDAKDAILYALGVGMGSNPLDENELRFVYEKALETLPTFATVLGYPWGWLYEANSGATRLKHVLAAQSITVHRLLPAAGEVVSNLAVRHVIDKGRDKGALILTERELRDRKTGDLLCTLGTTMFCRADGGFGGPGGPVPKPAEVPDRKPDQICDLPTLPQSALIYRLCGDRNPLHIDPAVGRAAGFKGPILHGLCSFGVAAHALLKTCFGYDPARFGSMEARFSAPVYPGETIRTEMWREGGEIRFRAKVIERDAVVLNNGQAGEGR